MYFPSKDEFRRKAEQGNLIPVYKEILGDLETPVSAFRKLSDHGYAFLLESVEGGENVGRHSFLGGEHFLLFESKGRRVTVTSNGERRELELSPGNDPLRALKTLLEKYRWVPVEGLPRFCGGAVGYLGYDLVRFFEELPDLSQDDLNLPDCMLVFTGSLLIFDHVKHRIKVLSNALVEGDPGAAYDRAVEKIETIISRLKSSTVVSPVKMGGVHGQDAHATGGTGVSPVMVASGVHGQDAHATIRSTFSREGFEMAVTKAKEYIAAGDCIQVVLSQRLSQPVAADPFDIYRALRSVNPSPYMYYLTYGDLKIIGSSPERLVSEEDGVVVTRPIAGSRPRGADQAEDERLRAELLSDPKERAEHIMLADLGRNDIGRVCQYGSVQVDQLMTVENYSHVMHIVSNVRGRLRDGFDQFDVLRACFPAGTLTGAPKVRAMEIIEELEPTKRGPYGGVIGYFSFSGNMDTAITIRTAVVKDGVAYIQAGAGLVADSVPATEYQETMNKAGALLRAIELAEAGLE